jgi:hypothetical protein
MFAVWDVSQKQDRRTLHRCNVCKLTHALQKRLRLQSRLIYTNLLLKVSVYYRIVINDFASITPQKVVIYFPIIQVVCQKGEGS